MIYKPFNGLKLPSQSLYRKVMAYPFYEDANRDILRIHKNREVTTKKNIYDPANGHSNIMSNR